MGILDKIVEWIAEQVMNILNLFTNSILDSLGMDLSNFKRYFPAASTLYEVFVALGLGLLILNFIWGVFRNFGFGIGVEAESPGKLLAKTVLFFPLVFYAGNIIDIALNIGGKPYQWILDDALPEINFTEFNSVLLTSVGSLVSGSVLLISLILLVVLAWNYLKLLLEAAERYIVLGVLAFTAPVVIATGASATTNSIFKSWCRMFASQIFLLIMNAWCLKIFVSMVGSFIANPLATGEGSNLFVWFLCAIGFLKVATKIDSIMGSLGLSTARSGGGLLGDAMVAIEAVTGMSRRMTQGSSSSGKTNPLEKTSGSMENTFSGGLAGIASRKTADVAASSLSNTTPNGKGLLSTLSGKAMKESFGKEGGFASSVIGGIATDPTGKKQISGVKGEEAFGSYFGLGTSNSLTDKSNPLDADHLTDMPDSTENMASGIPMSMDDPQMESDSFENDISSDVNGFSEIPSSPSDNEDPFGAPMSTLPSGESVATDSDISSSEAILNTNESGAFPLQNDSSIGASTESASLGGSTSASLGGSPRSSSKSSQMDSGYQSSGSLQTGAFQNIFGSSPDSQYRGIQMGGGEISGVEFNHQNPNGIRFSMYYAGKFSEPEGKSRTVQSKDGASWYLQYAEPTIKRTPVSEHDGKVEYTENIVHRLPPKPRQLGR